MKYIIVSGGVSSSIGKGVTSSSLGVVLNFHGHNPTAIKIDPYLNVDCGTISPYEHGEVFITTDGVPSDLDLGNYERFLNVKLTGEHNITSGKVFQRLLQRERRGGYLGSTVQLVPHFTDIVIDWIERVAAIPVSTDSEKSDQTPDVCLIELGGTVGDLESLVHTEALRKFTYKHGSENVCHVHVSYVPILSSTQEFKTKPLQHSMQRLRETLGIVPDLMFVRCEKPMSDDTRKKIDRYCQVRQDSIFIIPDHKDIHEVPLTFSNYGVYELISKKLNFAPKPFSTLHATWKSLLDRFNASEKVVRVGVVGKYVGLIDSYISLMHSINHAACALGVKADIHWLDSDKDQEKTRTMDGIIIPGGYGRRGVEGMISVAKWCREEKKPCFGICLGAQVQVIEFARYMCGIEDATSEEFDPDAINNPVIVQCPEFYDQGTTNVDIDKTTRLGDKPVNLSKGTQVHEIYGGRDIIYERHRHRYSVNFAYASKLREKGMSISGKWQGVAEVTEVTDHPFYLSVQFHPEFTSYLTSPHPLFVAFLKKVIG